MLKIDAIYSSETLVHCTRI